MNGQKPGCPVFYWIARKVGVLGCPNLPHRLNEPESGRGNLMVAVDGQGAFQRAFDSDAETQIQVARLASPSDAIFCESVEAGHSSHGDNAKIASLLGIHRPSVRMDSQCKYGVVARGEAGLYLRLPVDDTYVEKIWDHAAGSLVVTEAGGFVSDANGRPLDFTQGRYLTANRGIVATCAFDGQQKSRIHSTVLSAVAQALDTSAQVQGAE
ncbi:uncharacterized protein BJ171DRAFT_581074 [Polychytrium aggregatum]|uniref:uncharacterized protein n=1 Tax=Polychytrium aggregatum TaxID=110093 RepID=UPI0022FE9660|nr:uncharacterized protein BJ171DRAFT_581074 [Polychytrium aggregatum]KAI9205389.1 hypothetical protein BJ171DRAFT_581074 [Polychytrium aggregatum]